MVLYLPRFILEKNATAETSDQNTVLDFQEEQTWESRDGSAWSFFVMAQRGRFLSAQRGRFLSCCCPIKISHRF